MSNTEQTLVACIAKKGQFIAGTFDTFDEKALYELVVSLNKQPNVKRAWIADDCVYVERYVIGPFWLRRQE